MRAAKSIFSSYITMHQPDRIDGRFMGGSQTADEGFDNPAGYKITQSDSETKGRQNEQDGFPIAVFIYDQARQEHIERDPGLGTTDDPHQ
jgi:hypothetical protein